MKITALAFVIFGFAATAFASDRTVSRFGFQDISLNAGFAALDPRWKKDCVQSKNTRHDFCISKAAAGDVPLTVEIGFLDGYVNTIYVSFPSTEYDTLLAALRLKYGKEDVSTPATARWWSHSPGSSSFPDAILIRKTPERKPKPDGLHWMQGVDYSEIEYLSAWTISHPIDSVHPEKRKKIQETSRGL